MIGICSQYLDFERRWKISDVARDRHSGDECDVSSESMCMIVATSNPITEPKSHKTIWELVLKLLKLLCKLFANCESTTI